MHWGPFMGPWGGAGGKGGRAEACTGALYSQLINGVREHGAMGPWDHGGHGAMSHGGRNGCEGQEGREGPLYSQHEASS